MKKLELVIQDWTFLGLIVDGKPISKAKFKKLADIHTYGRGRNNLKVLYFYTHPKAMCYAFYPSFSGDTITNIVNAAYKRFIKVVEGNFAPFGNEDIVFGNSGLPLSYSKITVRGKIEDVNKEYYKRELDIVDPSSATIELKDDKGNKTRRLNLTQDSAKDLIDWIELNFVKLKK
jgi:hypothetical protein